MNSANRIFAILITCFLLLSIPLIAMQFTTDVSWTFSDFLVMGFLLFGTGITGEWVWRKAKTPLIRFGLLAFIFGIFLLVWAELAVGIFNSPLAGS